MIGFLFYVCFDSNQRHMTPGPRQSTGTSLTAGFIFAGFVFSLAVNLPGHLSYDSVIQLLEGRTGEYAGWHPPVTSWLLGLTDAVVPGTALFVAMNTLFIFGSLYVLLRLVPAPSWAAAVLAALFALTPQYMIYPGIVWKDVLFAATSVMGFAALARAGADWPRRWHRNAWLGFAFVLLIGAALARQNGIVMLLAGIVAFAWIAARAEGVSIRTIAMYGGGALLASVLALSAANVALGTRLVETSGAARQFKLLQLYDTVAMLAAEPDMPLDRIETSDPALARMLRSEGLRLYTPQRNDPLAGSAPLQAAVNGAPSGLLSSQWFYLIAHHPFLYLGTRADMFYWVFLTPRIDLCLPFYVGVSGPQDEMDDLDISERWDARDVWLQHYGNRFLGTPVLQHGIFAALSVGAAIFLLRRRRASDIAIAMLQIGALGFAATFFFISLACDYRYLYALDLAAMTGWFTLALDWRLPDRIAHRLGIAGADA